VARNGLAIAFLARFVPDGLRDIVLTVLRR
jgi:hypothetical protein